MDIGLAPLAEMVAPDKTIIISLQIKSLIDSSRALLLSCKDRVFGVGST